MAKPQEAASLLRAGGLNLNQIHNSKNFYRKGHTMKIKTNTKAGSAVWGG